MKNLERGIGLFEEITRPFIDSGTLIVPEWSRSRDGTFSVSTEIDSVEFGSIRNSVARTSPAKTGALIVELRETRVAELIAEGVGTRPSNEYSRLQLGHLEANSFDVEIWRSLLDEAIEFARKDFTGLECWQLQKEGSRAFDTELNYFITDLAPDEYGEAFSDLPDSAGFIERLRRLFGTQSPIDPGRWQLYVVPERRNAVGDDELLQLAKKVVQMELQIVEESGVSDSLWMESRPLYENLSFERVAERPDYNDCDNALSTAVSNVLRWKPEIDNDPTRGRWQGVLSEACYYIAASNGLRDWLLQDWLMTTVDLEPYYNFFRAGGQLFVLKDGQAHVHASYRD